MKYLKASIVCFVCAALTLWLMGCSKLDTTLPEYGLASDAKAKVHSLAVPVRGTERKSQLDKVLAGELFYANCDTYSRTLADLLIHRGADPAEVWLVNVSIPVAGFVWVNRGNGWKRVKADPHQVVLYRGMALDNRWPGVLTVKDLEWKYKFNKKMNMQDRQWVAWE